MTKILIDSANIEKAKELISYYNISGITTNPSILAKGAKNLFEKLKEIKEVFKEDLEIHIQTTEKSCEKIVLEAEKLKKYFGDNFFIKIPINKEGLKAAKECKSKNIKVTMTAIFTPLQVLAASKLGVDYVAPYVNRIDNIGGDSTKILEEMQKIVSNYDTKILAASFKNQNQIKDAVLVGAYALTISPELIEESIWHPYTDKSIAQFEEDWQKTFGDSKVVEYL